MGVDFGSQLGALAHLNRHGVVAIDSLKPYYEDASHADPTLFKNLSFEQWVSFLNARGLLATRPANTVEISHLGRDFLKYIAHVGKDVGEWLH